MSRAHFEAEKWRVGERIRSGRGQVVRVSVGQSLSRENEESGSRVRSDGRDRDRISKFKFT